MYQSLKNELVFQTEMALFLSDEDNIFVSMEMLQSHPSITCEAAPTGRYNNNYPLLVIRGCKSSLFLL